MHVVVDLSAHGFGHAGMTAAILIDLGERFNNVSFTLRSKLPELRLRECFPGPFRTAPAPPDPAMAMFNPFDVDAATSATNYNSLFGNWNDVIKAEVAKLRDLNADLVLANVPFVSLIAANELGIPAIACSPINWAGIYKAFCWEQPNGPDIHARILAAYRSARMYLQPTPSMPMDDLPNRRQIGPVARVGSSQRERLMRQFAQNRNERLVIVSFGGISGGPRFQLPQVSGIRWFVPDDCDIIRSDITRQSATGLSFVDLLASCEVIVTKPGYGIFAEAACNGVKVAYIPRPDWPEAPYLTGWLKAAWMARELSREAFLKGDIAGDIVELLSAPMPKPIVPTGVSHASRIIADVLLDKRAG